MNKSTHRLSVLLILFCASCTVFSQNVGINTSGSTPSVNAILDLNTGNSGRNMGVIVPHVELTTTLTQFSPPIISGATVQDTGMMVYNTNATAGSGVGYYYWNGTTWVSVTGSGGGGVSGSGTLNYIPKWTPNGTTLGNSLFYDNGTSIGLANTSPNSTAALDMSSITTQGLLTPQLTAAQITALTSPANGLIVFNKSTNCYQFYGNGAWQALSCPCSAAPTSGSISGSPYQCPSASLTYTVNAVGATSYSWSSSNTNLGAITSGGNTSIATVTTTAGTGTYTLTCIATNACGASTVTLAVYVGVGPVTYTWTDGGIAGDNYFYGDGQYFQLPAACGITTLTLTVVGGSGGSESGTYPGGLGASLTGTVTINAGDILAILVGGEGIGKVQGCATTDASGGGGATLVYDITSSTILAVAGGGGGSALNSGNGAGANAQINYSSAAALETPTNSVGGCGAGGTGGGASSGGSAGTAGTYQAGGGAGFGEAGGGLTGGPDTWTCSCEGGSYYGCNWGGFGGAGGASNAGYGGGGGGGYNGGGGGNEVGNAGYGGGGGGSYWQNVSNITVSGYGLAGTTAGAGNGSVTITW